MIAEPFANQKTWVHRLDPRLRICAAFFLSCLFAITTQPGQAACGLLASAMLLGCSRPPMRALLRRLAAVNLFILFLWCSVPFFTPGTPIALPQNFSCTREGLELVWLITLKANAITLLLIACIGTMSASVLGHGLQALGLPDKLVHLLLFTSRSLFVLAEEWQRLQTALRLRGFVAGTNLRTYRTVGYLFGLTLLDFKRQDFLFATLLVCFVVFFLFPGAYHLRF